jgi:hypothetical protein
MPPQCNWIQAHHLHLYRRCSRLSWLRYCDTPSPSPETNLTSFFETEMQWLISALFSDIPNAVIVRSDCSDTTRIRQSEKALSTQNSVINGCITSGPFMARFDGLIFSDNQWVLSVIYPGFRFQKRDYMDVAFLVTVLENAGIFVDDITLVGINSHYCRGKTLQLNALCRHTTITDKVKALLPAMASKMTYLHKHLTTTPAPNAQLGLRCLAPTPCIHVSTCFPALNDQSILHVSGISKHRKLRYIQDNVCSLHALSMATNLSRRQSIQVSASLDNTDYLQPDLVREFFDSLTFPLYFMDFEIAQFMIPPFKGLTPLYQLPFLYSVHSLTHIDGAPDHDYFFHDGNDDPSLSFANAIIKLIPAGVPVIVFNSHLERHILKQLATAFPSLSEPLLRIASQLVDLYSLFLSDAYYHPKMKGKYSLKTIYGAIAPDDPNQYHHLHIQNGESANIAYKQFIYETDDTVRDSIISNLHDYCRLDTYSMVVILQHLYRRLYTHHG